MNLRLYKPYSILYHDEMLESNTGGHMQKHLQGVYCHKADTAHKAENYMVFEDVGSNGHWWAAMLQLSVDRSSLQNRWSCESSGYAGGLMNK